MAVTMSSLFGLGTTEHVPRDDLHLKIIQTKSYKIFFYTINSRYNFYRKKSVSTNIGIVDCNQVPLALYRLPASRYGQVNDATVKR